MFELLTFKTSIIAIVLLLIIVATTISYTMDNSIRKVRLVPIGLYGSRHDLRDYFVDKFGNLYSMNSLSWEINKYQRKDMLILSNNSTDRQGNIVNSFRDSNGNKVTIRRDKLKYHELKLKNGFMDLMVEETTNRHLKVYTMKDSRTIRR